MSCSEWNQYSLNDVIEQFIDYRGRTPKKVESGIPLITAKIVKNGRIEEATEFIRNEDYDKWMTRGIPMNGDVVMTTEAPLGEVAQININDKIALAQRIITLRGKKNILDNTFLKYSLQSPIMQWRIQTRASGTTVLGIKSSELKKVVIDLPSLRVQKRIGNILSSLDKKIELNNEMNKTLEEMAQAIFKRWFVDFEFPNEEGKPYKSSGGEMFESEMGMIPKGWKVGVLADLVNVKYGKDHKKLEEGSIPVFGSGGIMRYVNRSLYEKESVLIPRKGTLNNVIYVNQPFWSVDTMFFTEMKLPNIAKFVYQFVKSKDLAMMNIGSAVPSMTTSILNSMEIVIPDEKNLEKYDEIVTSFYTKLEFNKSNSSNLITLRDSLLPKLMSGEIRVNDIEANL